MPAVSKDQQRASAIALDARKKGTADKLPSGAAKEMAKSMSMKELEKLASTKHKDLPEKKKESKHELIEWAGVSLAEAMEMDLEEEMIGVSDTDDPEEQIVTQKSKKERIDDKEIKNGKEAEDSWVNTVHGSSPALAHHSAGMMSSNTMGARVAESVDNAKKDVVFESSRWQKLANIKKA